MKIGDRVVTEFPDKLESDFGTIIDGPEFRNNIAVFKVHYSDHDNWVPSTWLKSSMKIVNNND